MKDAKVLNYWNTYLYIVIKIENPRNEFFCIEQYNILRYTKQLY